MKISSIISKENTFCLCVATFAALMLAAPATAAEKYPVWWSPELELESVDAIDERLARKFSKWVLVEVSRVRNGITENAVMDRCASMFQLADRDFEPVGLDYGRYLNIYAECSAIEFLIHARPAGRSFVHEFKWGPSVTDKIPFMFQLLMPCSSVPKMAAANNARLPLTEFIKIENSRVLPGGQFEIRTKYDRSRLEIIIRADLNRDGQEDLAILVGTSAIGGTGNTSALFIVSRDSTDGVLYVVDEDVERHRCNPP